MTEQEKILAFIDKAGELTTAASSMAAKLKAHILKAQADGMLDHPPVAMAIAKGIARLKEAHDMATAANKAAERLVLEYATPHGRA